jgi:large subunit ribosomal protein L24
MTKITCLPAGKFIYLHRFMKIKKGDNVILISGKDKGKEGKVTRALPQEERVIVEGVNITKRHRKPRARGEAGQIVEFSAPVHVSNVMLKDPKEGTPTRFTLVRENGKAKRISKKSGSTL